jgi:hypothetical protein
MSRTSSFRDGRGRWRKQCSQPSSLDRKFRAGFYQRLADDFQNKAEKQEKEIAYTRSSASLGHSSAILITPSDAFTRSPCLLYRERNHNNDNSRLAFKINVIRDSN